VQAREVLELVADPHLGVQAALLGEISESFADLVRHASSPPANLAGVRFQHAEDDAHGGSLTGTVGPDEAEQLPFGDGEGQVVEGDQVAVAAGQALELQHVVPPVLAPGVMVRVAR
jgi:hypothetical protein